MLESGETEWRLGAEPEDAEEKAAKLSSEEDEKKEELQETVQERAEEIGGGEGEGEGSFVTRQEEMVPIAEAPKKNKGIAKVKHPAVKREPDSSKDMVKISKQLERQANQLAGIEKAIPPLQNSFNRIDKQSNTIKQLYTEVTQLQRQIRSTKNRKQNHGIQNKKRGKSLVSRSKKRSLKGRR
jgi:hypothetical protein